MSFEAMALINSNIGEENLALIGYSKAIDIYRELVEINFDVYSSGLSNVLNNLAVLHYKMKKYDSSEKMYQEALEIRSKLAKKNPDFFSKDLAFTLFNVANLLKVQNKINQAEEKYLEAVKIFRQLQKGNPGQFDLFLVKNLVGLSLFYKDSKKDKDKSILYCKEADAALSNIAPNPEVLSLRQYTESITKAWGG